MYRSFLIGFKEEIVIIKNFCNMDKRGSVSNLLMNLFFEWGEEFLFYNQIGGGFYGREKN